MRTTCSLLLSITYCLLLSTSPIITSDAANSPPPPPTAASAASSSSINVNSLLSRATTLTDAFDLADIAYTLSEAGYIQESVIVLRRAVSFKSALSRETQAQLTYNLAYALQQLGGYAEAVEVYEAAGSLGGGAPDAWIKAAQCAKEMGESGKAVGYLQHGIKAYGGNNPQIYLYLGDTLNNIKRFTESEKAYRDGIAVLKRVTNGRLHDPQALSLAVSLLKALGDVLLNMRNHAGALEQFAAATRLAPQDAELLASAWMCRADLAFWKDWDERTDALIETTARAVLQEYKPSPMPPYTGLFLDMNHSLRAHISASWSNRLVEQSRKTFGWSSPWFYSMKQTTDGVENNDSNKKDKTMPSFSSSSSSSFREIGGSRATHSDFLHLGYVSRRFEEYPGTHLMLGMFSRHDRNRSYVSCYASGRDDQSDTRKAVKEGCDAFADISELTPGKMAAEVSDIRESKDNDSRGHSGSISGASIATDNAAAVDVLVDYDGLHDFNNIHLLALRPARTQITFLGFAATTGQGLEMSSSVTTSTASSSLHATSLPLPTVPAIDYAVVDRTTAPPEVSAQMFTEKLLYVPGSYQPQNPLQASRGGVAMTVPFPISQYHYLFFSQSNYTSSNDNNEGEASVSSTITSPTLTQWNVERAASRQKAGLPGTFTRLSTKQRMEGEDKEIETGVCVPIQINTANVPSKNIIMVPETLAPSTPKSVSSINPVLHHLHHNNKQNPVVFVSFNRWHKVDPLIWTSWMNILQRTPLSILWIYGGGTATDEYAYTSPTTTTTTTTDNNNTILPNSTASATLYCNGTMRSPIAPPMNLAAFSKLPESQRAVLHMANLHAEAAAHGIHPSRIKFAGKAPRDAHLARHLAGDVMFDTRVYGAHTTAADGLYAGIPVLTLPGASFASRVGASLLRVASSGDTMTTRGKKNTAMKTATYSHQEYENIGTQLGGENEAIRTMLRSQIAAGIRKAVRRNNKSSENTHGTGTGTAAPVVIANDDDEPFPPLFDTQAFTDSFETALRAAMEVDAVTMSSSSDSKNNSGGTFRAVVAALR